LNSGQSSYSPDDAETSPPATPGSESETIDLPGEHFSRVIDSPLGQNSLPPENADEEFGSDSHDVESGHAD
jgi:hypothetical protein